MTSRKPRGYMSKGTCLIGGLATLAALALGVGRVEATSMRVMPLAELVQRSQKIVHGIVSNAEVFDSTDSIWTLYTMQVSKAAKGALASSRQLRFRCEGGTTTRGTMRIPGTPQFRIGEEVVIFYAPENYRCQVMGWNQGSFRALASPSGTKVVVNSGGGLILGMSAEGLVLGQRPSWVEVSRDHVSMSGWDRGIVTDATDTAATVDDFVS